MRSASRGETRAGDILVGSEWEFRYRTLIIVVICTAAIGLALMFPDPLTDRGLWIELPWMCAIAAGVAAVGVGIRVWATGYLPFAIIADRDLHASRLVDTGPYALTRNPLYLGTWLAVSSLGLVLNLWAAVILPAVMALKVRRIIGFEERRLREAFGKEYEAYAARVRRLIPRSPASIGQALREKTDWLYGIKGNLFMIGLPIGYLAATIRPSFATVLVCVAVGGIAQWPFLEAERSAWDGRRT